MKTKNNRPLTTVLLGVALAITPVAAQASIHVTKVHTLQDETGTLLKDARLEAYDLHDHASALQAANPSQLDRYYFIAQFNTIRDDVNTMGRTIARLQSLESYSGDKSLIERARAELATVAKTADGAIEYMNENPDRLELPVYRDMTRSLRDETDNLWKLLNDSAALGHIKTREERLQTEMSAIQGE